MDEIQIRNGYMERVDKDGLTAGSDEMAYLGIDTVHRFTAADAKKAAANGVSFVGRYLVPEAYGKALTPDEIRGLRSAGLAIALCWEIGGADMRGGAAQGARDGAEARRIAEGFGVGAGTSIFFACDFSPAASELDTLAAYLRAAARELGAYRCGVYGSFAVVEGMARRGACDAFWQCCAWSGGREIGRAHV